MPYIARRKHRTCTIALMVFSLTAWGFICPSASAAKAPDRQLQQRIDRLEAGVQAAEAIRAVKRLQYTYGYYLESGLWADLMDLFAINAIGQFQTVTVSGKQNLRSHFMAEAARKSLGLEEGQLNAHFLLQPIVTLGVDGKTAKGTWHEMAMLGKFGSSASWRGGIYENEYVLEKNVWKITKLRYYEQYRGAYDEWGHKAPSRWDIPYHFEAAHVGVTIPASALQSLVPISSNAPAAKRLPRLERRVQRLNDEIQVQNLQHIYGYYLDRKMWDDVADLFEEQGSNEVEGRGTYVGKARIRRAMEALYGPFPLRNGELFDHVNLGTVVTIAADGRSAGVRTRQLSLLGLNGEHAQWEIGTYENEFVKEDDVWKIKAVYYYQEMSTDYDKGWARYATPVLAASKEFPPDHFPVRPMESYPKVHYVAFHYRNPVTGRTVQYPKGDVLHPRTLIEGRDMPSAKLPGNAGLNLEVVLSGTERKLDAAIAVDAVENLNSSYGYYIDESAWDSMADTFASTGSKEITGAGVYVGRDRIRKVLNLRGPLGGRTPSFFTIHQLTQPVIHISEDGIHAKARLRLFQSGGNADGSSGSWIGGIYENTAIKEDGEWKFGDQDLMHTYNASYRNGWARVGAAALAKLQPSAQQTGRAVPGGGIQQGLGGAASPTRFMSEFPPDRPIRSKQYAFPEIIEPAFHYKNPVTGRMPADLLP
jgi:hypothetical protein